MAKRVGAKGARSANGARGAKSTKFTAEISATFVGLVIFVMNEIKPATARFSTGKPSHRG